ncbi:MAG: acyltransferase family protein [Rhodanobacteraceae bacterium]|nr:acyltransferase family protein [Rhodanobacteraceae bacterium]
MRTLATAAARGSDNFMWLRHAAAIMVLWAHSYGMSSSGLAEPLSRWLAGFDAGRGAVYLFFATSGYLIALSLVRNDAVLRYVWHRSLRIYPAYAACLLFCVFVVGATFTSLPIADYFASRHLVVFRSQLVATVDAVGPARRIRAKSLSANRERIVVVAGCRNPLVLFLWRVCAAAIVSPSHSVHAGRGGVDD